jgi:hypothetical protein
MNDTMNTAVETAQEDLFDWGAEETVEVAESTSETGQGDAQEATAQAEQESAPEAASEAEAVDAQAAQAEGLLTVKFHGKEQQLTMEQARELAQKGMIHDVLSQKLDAAMPAFQLIEEYAKRSGMSAADYMAQAQRALEEQATQALVAQGMPEDAARELHRLRQEKNQRDQQDAQAQQQQAQQQQAQTERRQQFLQLLAEYPDVKELPPEVMNAVVNGEAPLSAYRAWENKQLKAQLAAQKTDQRNRNTAPGSAQGLGKTGATDPFEAGWDSV